MGELPKQLRDVAVYLAPLGSHSGATCWEAAELMRQAADALAGVREATIEECAKIAERAGCGDPKCTGCYGNQIAASIRELCCVEQGVDK